MSGPEDELTDLEPVVVAARRYPDSFLVGRLSPATEQAVAASLRLDRLRMQRLLLCRQPRSAGEVAEIARFVGVDPGALACALGGLGGGPAVG